MKSPRLDIVLRSCVDSIHGNMKGTRYRVVPADHFEVFAGGCEFAPVDDKMENPQWIIHDQKHDRFSYEGVWYDVCTVGPHVSPKEHREEARDKEFDIVDIPC